MSKLNAMLRRFFARRAAVSPAPTLAAPEAPEAVDLASIRSLDRAVVELRHPVSGKPLGASVTLASPDHPARRQARLDISRAQRSRPEPDQDLAQELVDENAAAFLSRVIFDWSGIKVDGELVPFSAAAALDLLGREEMRWLVNQLLYESARTENFIETSAIA